MMSVVAELEGRARHLGASASHIRSLGMGTDQQFQLSRLAEQFNAAGRSCQTAAADLREAHLTSRNYTASLYSGSSAPTVGPSGSATSTSSSGGAGASTEVERFSREVLFRADGRSPEELWSKGGLLPRSPEAGDDLATYVMENRGNFVGTTRDAEVAAKWGKAWVYQVIALGGIDVNRSMPQNPHASEQEIAFRGGIPLSAVLGVMRVLPDGSLGPLIPLGAFRPST